MEKWLKPEDLQHNFEVEKLINEFVKSVGGQLVNEMISKSPNFENADYFFDTGKVLIELKCLQTDFPLSSSLAKKATELFSLWLANGEVTPNMLFNTSKLPRNKRIYLNKIYSEPLRRIIKKANRQLKSTEQHFNLAGNQNLLLIVNDGLYSFEPPFLIRLICDILLKEFSSIHGFVYLTVNRYVSLPNDEFANHIWIPSYSKKADKSLVKFVDELGGNWFEFFGNKIGGYDRDLIQTDKREFIKNSRNILTK